MKCVRTIFLLQVYTFHSSSNFSETSQSFQDRF